jgi:hypothetical protein
MALRTGIDQEGAPLATAAQTQSRTGMAWGRRGRPKLGRGREGEHFTIAARATRGAQTRAYERGSGEPLYRPLRIFTMDPSASRRDGAIALVKVPYEPLDPGPVGALLEVVGDADLAGDKLDLDDRVVLLDQGKAPSPSSPQFRRQMVYAVCSTTYAAFRQALGRDIGWGFDRGHDTSDPARLRILPCALDTPNAFYDKQRGELRFGVFTAGATVAGRNAPNGQVFTCLSHDVVAHEMSHALLDGLRARFTIPSNPDVLAFHEAFADLVAVFQRFTYTDVVRSGIRASGGQLRGASLLTDIARQFGETTGMARALRSAIGGERVYDGTGEPHELGAVLVAAVFEAFITIYDRKANRLVRLATGGSGIVPPGALPELLVDALVDTACKLAAQFLSICIRAIDYCPPIDMTFGEYLRAMITADYDLVPDDPWGYREALIDSFRNRAIYPQHVMSLSEDALLWSAPTCALPDEPELGFDRLRFAGDPGRPAGPDELMRQARAVGQLVADPRYREEFGLIGAGDARLDGDSVDLPVVESVRSSRRVGPSGQVVFDLVAEVTQRRRARALAGSPGFDFLGGATVILNPMGGVRYAIRKSIIQNARLAAQCRFVADPRSPAHSTRFGMT